MGRFDYDEIPVYDNPSDDPMEGKMPPSAKAVITIEIGEGNFTWKSNCTYEDTIKYLEIVKMDAFKQLTKPKGE